MDIKVVVHVENGRVDGVYTDNPEVNVQVFDFDEYNEENPKECDFTSAIAGMKSIY
ncbi:MAG: hypothetical protein HPY53_01580 [Brevinematales bacterium]|nr:hypothetical protein [Brevinematales bacterium]